MRCGIHSIHCVRQQIQDDLLDLQAIARNLGKPFSQSHVDRNTTPRRLMLEEFKNLREKFVEPLLGALRRSPTEKSAQTLYDFSSVARVSDDSPKRLARSVEIRRIIVEPTAVPPPR